MFPPRRRKREAEDSLLNSVDAVATEEDRPVLRRIAALGSAMWKPECQAEIFCQVISSGRAWALMGPYGPYLSLMCLSKRRWYSHGDQAVRQVSSSSVYRVLLFIKTIMLCPGPRRPCFLGGTKVIMLV